MANYKWKKGKNEIEIRNHKALLNIAGKQVSGNAKQEMLCSVLRYGNYPIPFD